jgi:type IV pilus assembly protein PilC
MSIQRALRLSMEATANGAFVAAAPIAVEAVKGGDDLTLSLAKTNLFTTEFLHIMEVAEESGTLAEVMQRQADHYDDEASRRLKTLTSVAGGAVYFFVGACIVFAIIRLYSFYISGIMSTKV